MKRRRGPRGAARPLPRLVLTLENMAGSPLNGQLSRSLSLLKIRQRVELYAGKARTRRVPVLSLLEGPSSLGLGYSKRESRLGGQGHHTDVSWMLAVETSLSFMSRYQVSRGRDTAWLIRPCSELHQPA